MRKRGEALIFLGSWAALACAAWDLEINEDNINTLCRIWIIKSIGNRETLIICVIFWQIIIMLCFKEKYVIATSFKRLHFLFMLCWLCKLMF